MKTYFLLRNNQKAGPYTANGLKEQKLEKWDLIWEEGTSITWKYPSELEEFKADHLSVPVTEASLIQERKELQIRYFDVETSHHSAGYADAYQADIPPGYEYLLIASQKLDTNTVRNIESHINRMQPVDVFTKAELPVRPSVFQQNTIDIEEKVATQKADTVLSIRSLQDQNVKIMPRKRRKRTIETLTGVLAFIAMLGFG